MTSARQIGRGTCPVCDSDRARFSLSKKDLVCVTCDGCNIQIFARSATSDALLRRHIKQRAEEATAPEQVPEAPTQPPPPPPPPRAAEPLGGFGLKWF
jgi:hypothetical protein